jgi:hypothetical protein
MYCPACRAEYQEGITECADCQVALVAALSEADGDPTMETVRVWVEPESWRAHLLKQALEETGIACWSDWNSGILPTGELGETGLWVRKQDEAKAREVLGELGGELAWRPPDSGEREADEEE